MTLKIDLPPDVERRLQEEASRRGEAPADYARAVLEERLAGLGPGVPKSPYAGLPRRDPQELIELARQQGAQVPLRFDELKGSFWPEDEDIDEFLATLRDWRQERRETSTG